MFELLDGRASAYQWDTGLYVNCTGLKETDEVHFCRPGVTLAILPAVVGETLAASVPDELLQTADTIVIFAYIETETGGMTRVEKRLGITSRPKPPTYVYTPSEALRYKTLEERIDKLEETGEYYIPGATLDGNSLQLTFTPSQPTMPVLEPTAIDFPMEKTLADHVANTANPHGVSAVQIGAAPAGYGLGEQYGRICADANTATTVGFYSMGGTGTLNVPDGAFMYGVLLAERRFGQIVQTLKSADGFAHLQMATRSSLDDGTTWSEWEWVNPPLEIGVEYLTTERWMGKKIYKQLVNLGGIPENSTKQVSVVSGGIITDLRGLAAPNELTYSGYVLPALNSVDANNKLEFWNTGNTVHLKTTATGWSAFNAYAVVSYYRT